MLLAGASMAEVRPERSDDFSIIRELIVQVFSETFGSGMAEANLVEDLRSSDAYVPTLSLVAVHENNTVGYVMFSEVHIISRGKAIAALALAPLGVRKQYRGQGIGATLVRQGLETGQQIGYRAVFVQGSPTYYGRFGFVPASSHGLTMPFPDIPDPDNMVVELGDDSLSEICGYVEYPAPWEPFR
jgi:predicted N-acetyltransferase YhbS